MAKFVFERSVSLKDFMYLSKYTEGKINNPTLVTAKYGDSGISFTGENFHGYYNEQHGTRVITGMMESLTYKTDGTLSLKITGLYVDMESVDTSFTRSALATLTKGSDLMIGSKGADTLAGHAGKDALRGNAGNDVLSGGEGNDWLTGGAGSDRLTGGAGRDTFIFLGPSDSSEGKDRDIITDFDSSDRINLAAIDANEHRRGDQSFTFIGRAAFTKTAGELHLVRGILSGDTDGDGRADVSIAVRGHHAPDAGDFLL